MSMFNLVIFTVLISGILWLILAGGIGNLKFLGPSRGRDEEFEVPLRDVFLDFNHESTKAWLRWIDGQDESKKQFAYDKLVDYLDNPPKKLGAITGDVVKAIIVFKQKTDAFQVLAKLLRKTRDHFLQFKSVDIFYETAAIGLTKIDYIEAEKYLIKELDEIKYRKDLAAIQIYLIRALSKLAFTPELEKCWIRVLTNHEYPENTKKELLRQLDDKADSVKERIFQKIIKDQIDSNATSISEIDKFILEEIFLRLTSLISKEDYDQQIWHTLLSACDSPKLKDLFIKLFAEMIEFGADTLQQNQMLELINKEEPARTRFIEACSRKHGLTKKEISLLRVPFKDEDLNFDKIKFNVEKSKKTMAISDELAGDYRYLEKALLAYETGKTEKSSNAIAVMTGTGENEKFYLSRCFAANHNKSFIYVDVQQILSADGMVKEFKNHVSHAKPCLVYLDKMEKVLNVDLEKRLANNLKTINKSVKELSILPSVSFVANIPFNRDELKNDNPKLHSKFLNSTSNLYSIMMNKDKPGEDERARIIKEVLEKIDPIRLRESKDFDIESLIKYSKNMDLIQLVKFLHSYLEISLIASGKLVSIEEFNERWINDSFDLDEVEKNNEQEESNELTEMKEKIDVG